MAKRARQIFLWRPGHRLGLLHSEPIPTWKEWLGLLLIVVFPIGLAFVWAIALLLWAIYQVVQ